MTQLTQVPRTSTAPALPSPPRSEPGAAGVARRLLAHLGRAHGTLPLLAIGIAALVLRVGYVAVTPYNVREHDIVGHVEYIEYLLTHHALPRNGDGFSFYHPPTYFLLAAGQWKLLELLHVGRGAILVSLQVQSVLWELGFAAFSIGTARLWLDELPARSFGARLRSRRGLEALLAALVLLWPSSVMHAARIGNDDMVYFFFGASLFFTTRWWLPRGRGRDLTLAAVAAALGVVTKSNALLLFVVIALLFVHRLAWTERERRISAYLKRGWPVMALAVVSTALSLGTAARDALAGRRPSLLIGNAYAVSPRLAVGNRAENYLWFDLKPFVTQAWSSSWDDEHGRQWFWNFLLKTSLFGDFQFESPWLWNVAVCLSVLYLALLATFAAGLLFGGESARRDLPLRVTAGVLVASLALLRMRHPNACSNDFRYILPVLAPVLCLHLRMLTGHHGTARIRLARSGAALGWAFAGLSAIFLATLVLVSKR